MSRETSAKVPRRKRRMPEKQLDRMVNNIKLRLSKMPSQETMAIIDEAIRADRNKRDRR